MTRRLLVLTRHTPLPWEDGVGAYLFDLLGYLHGRGFEVHVGWLNPPADRHRSGRWILPAGFARIVRLHLPGGFRLGRRIFFPSIFREWLEARLHECAGRFRTRTELPAPRRPAPPPAPTAPPSPADFTFAQRLIGDLRPGNVIANEMSLTPLFAAAPADLSFRRICLQYDAGGPPASLTYSDTDPTAALLRAAAVVVCTSALDARQLQPLAPEADFIVAPKSATPHPHPSPPTTSARLLFVGSGSSSNSAGLAWFLAGVWPAVRAARPDARLDVCGSIAAVLRERPAGVHFHGLVAEPGDYYRQADLVVVPLPQVARLASKLVDAAAWGRAIVTTRAVLTNAPFLVGSVATADTAADFTNTILRLLAHPAERLELAERCLALVRAHLAPDACYGTLAGALS